VAEQSGASRSERLAADLDGLPGAVDTTILGADSSDDEGPIMGECPGEVGRTLLEFDPADSSDEERLQKGRSPCKGISAYCV